MPPKRIKLGKKDDIANVVRQIRSVRDRDIIFELEKGSLLLKNSNNLKLMKRTGEAMGKRVLIETDDELGKILARKAGVWGAEDEVKLPRSGGVRVARSDVKPRFSDIGRPKMAVPKPIMPQKKVLPTEKVKEVARTVTTIPSRFSKKYFWILASIVLVFFALAVLLPKASITVLARSEPISRDMEITVNASAESVDNTNLIIPGVSVRREVSQTKNFPTTGTSSTGAKSSGSVHLYNFTPFTLTLRASTTRLVFEGKNYFFTKDVTGIRATSRTGSQVNESTTTGPIEIVAEGGGDAYNLPANTRFQIVNQALGNQEVYAINQAPISGGEAGSAKALSEQDITNARSSLTEEVIKEAEKELSEETGKPMRIINTGVRSEVLADTANKEVGEETENFDMTLIARVTGLAFSETDVVSLVESKIEEVLSSDKYLVEEADKEFTASFKNLDLEAGRGVLSVHFETVAAYKLNDRNWSKILAGKNENEIKEIMLSMPEVDSVKVDFWPDWMVNKAPRWNGRIDIKTVISE